MDAMGETYNQNISQALDQSEEKIPLPPWTANNIAKHIQENTNSSSQFPEFGIHCQAAPLTIWVGQLRSLEESSNPSNQCWKGLVPQVLKFGGYL